MVVMLKANASEVLEAELALLEDRSEELFYNVNRTVLRRTVQDPIGAEELILPVRAIACPSRANARR
jgi:hypothetical protein